jgi:hypothetical protein
MKKTTALAIACAIAIAAVLGTVAVARTTTLGASAQRTSSKVVAVRTHKLDRLELALRRELRRMPPPLPAMHGNSGAASQPAAQRVIYRRPAPIVVVKHRSHGDDGGFEHEGEHESDD